MAVRVRPADWASTASCLGCGVEPCVCDDIARTARRIATAAFSYAEERQFRDASLAFAEALSLGFAPAWLHEGLGLCRLALGDAAAAEQSWREASALDEHSPACDWLLSLANGTLRDGIEHFNRALTAARTAEWPLAMRELDAVDARIRPFVPADQLRTLVRRASLQAPPRRYVLPSLATVLLVAMVGLGSWSFGRFERPPQPRAAAPKAVDGRSTIAPSTALEAGLGADADSISGLLAALRVDTSVWSPEARGALVRAANKAARTHFRIGRSAAAHGDGPPAVEEFGRALTLSGASPIRSDILYEYARSAAAQGDSSKAADAARELLREYPRSIYANSVMRAMAARGRPR